MRTLDQSDFLRLWEIGRSLHPLDQGVLAVQAAFPEGQESIADWPIGRRNRALAQLRCAAFRGPLRGWTVCRKCGEKLEFEVDGRALANEPASDDRAEMRPWVELGNEKYRLPTSRDLASLAKETDPAIAVQRLLQRCSGDGKTGKSHWTEEEIETVGEVMAAADPLAEIRLGFDCPTCTTHFDEDLDLASFLWAEIEALARRRLFEVHLLASAYGWSQDEILQLSAARREFYLQMVRT